MSLTPSRTARWIRPLTRLMTGLPQPSHRCGRNRLPLLDQLDIGAMFATSSWLNSLPL